MSALKALHCLHCEDEFTPQHHLQRTCSSRCSRIRKAQSRARWSQNHRRPVRNVPYRTNLPPNRGGDDSAFLDEPEPVDSKPAKTYAEYLAESQR